MPINIKQIFPSDSELNLIDKLNFNFDQIILAGGGPPGIRGPIGVSGPIGPQGNRGSVWFVNSDAPTQTPFNSPLIQNDYWLKTIDNEIYGWDGSSWVDTNLNLKGATGNTGQNGVDGSGFQFYLGALGTASPSPGITYGIYFGPSAQTGTVSTAGVVDFASSAYPKDSYFFGNPILASNLNYFGVPGSNTPVNSFIPYSGFIPKVTLIQDQVNQYGQNGLSFGAQGLYRSTSSPVTGITNITPGGGTASFFDFVNFAFITEGSGPYTTRFKIGSKRSSIKIQAGGATSGDVVSANLDLISTNTSIIGYDSITIGEYPTPGAGSRYVNIYGGAMGIIGSTSFTVNSPSITLQNYSSGGTVQIGSSTSGNQGNVTVYSNNLRLNGNTSIGLSSPSITIGNQSFPGALNEYYTILNATGATATITGTDRLSLISYTGGNPNYLVLSSDGSVNMNAVTTMGLSSPYVQIGGGGGATGIIANYASNFTVGTTYNGTTGFMSSIGGTMSFNYRNLTITGPTTTNSMVGINSANIDNGSQYFPSLYVNGHQSTIGSTANVAITSQGSIIIDSSSYGSTNNEGLFFRNVNISGELGGVGLGNWGLQYWKPSTNFTIGSLPPALAGGFWYSYITISGNWTSTFLVGSTYSFTTIGGLYSWVRENNNTSTLESADGIQFNLYGIYYNPSTNITQLTIKDNLYSYGTGDLSDFQYGQCIVSLSYDNDTAQSGLTFWKPGGTLGSQSDPQRGYLYLDDGGSVGVGTNFFEYSTDNPGTNSEVILDHGVIQLGGPAANGPGGPSNPSTAGWFPINGSYGDPAGNDAEAIVYTNYTLPTNDYIIEYRLGYAGATANPSGTHFLVSNSAGNSVIFYDCHTTYFKVSVNDYSGFTQNMIIYWKAIANTDHFLKQTNSTSTGSQVVSNYNDYYGAMPAKGSVIKGTAKFAVNGSLLCQSVITTSDERLKSNITVLGSEINKIKMLLPTAFNLNETPDVKSLGFIAQDVAKIYPEMIRVFKDPVLEGGKMTLDYLSFIPILTKGIQEQQDMIEDNDYRIKTLEQELEEIKNILYKNQIQ